MDFAEHYDHLVVAALDDPFPVLAEARERCPVVHSDGYEGFWALFGYDDVSTVAKDPARFSSAQGITIPRGTMLLLRTDWPKGHDTTDPSWWNDSPCLTKEAAEWLVAKEPSVLGYDFAQEEKGADYQTAEEILGSGMRVHRTILPRVVCQIENLTNLDQIPSRVKIIALPAKWKTESAPARVVALLD